MQRSSLQYLLRQGRENESCGEALRKLIDIKRVLHKGHFYSFAEKNSGPDPQDPLWSAPTIRI